MKKSNALMLSYMIFLAVALLAKIIFKWEGLNRISMAATVAGCFFAFADLTNWYVSNNMPMVDALQKEIDALALWCNAKLDSVRMNRREMLNILEAVEPYRNRNEHILEIIDITSRRAAKLEAIEKEIEKDAKAGPEEFNRMLDKERKKFRRYQIVEIVLVTIGFTVFFGLISFDAFANLLNSHEAIATVFAFIIIMFNYFLRDVLDEKSKHEVEDVLIKVSTMKEEINNMKEESKETPSLDKVKEMVQFFEKQDTVKEVC